WRPAPFFFSSRRRHTSWPRDWSSDVCSSDLKEPRVGNESAGTVFVLRTPRESRYVMGHDRFSTRIRCFSAMMRDPLRSERHGRKIGRASGRERGAKSGGSGTLKRKETKKIQA